MGCADVSGVVGSTIGINMARVLMMGGYAESLVNFRGALLREMVACGHEVHACAPEDSADIKAALADMGVTYFPVLLDRTGINPVRDLLAIKKLITLISTLKPDIFLGYTIKPVIYGSIAAKVAGVPAIFSMITGLGYSFSGDSLKSRLVGRVAGLLYRLALKFNTHVFFQNPDDLELFRQKGFIRDIDQAVLINGSGVDIDEYCPVAHPSSISFLLIARLLPDKGIYEYADAARKIREKYANVKFRLVGWMDKNPCAIEERDLHEWQVSGDIEFIGRLADVRPSLADCSVFVLPSYREGTPRTVLEAMAMGRPVITTNAPGCRETVSEGVNGYLIPVRDVDSLVNAMETFIKHPGLIKRMGKASREIAEEKYDVRKVNARIMQTMGIV